MPGYIQTTAEQWLKEKELYNSIISHQSVGDQYQQDVSDALKSFAKLVIEHTIENCKVHSDCPSDTDWDGAIVNTHSQFGL